MRYQFEGSFVCDPIRARRESNEKRSEDGFDFSHHIDPFRGSNDIVRIEAMVDAPGVLSESQIEAFERALNKTLKSLRRNIVEEFDALEVG